MYSLLGGYILGLHRIYAGLSQRYDGTFVEGYQDMGIGIVVLYRPWSWLSRVF